MSDSQRAVGLTVSSFTSVSLNPPLVLICVHRQSRVLAHLRRTRRFGINVLAAHQHAVAAHFARSGDHGFGSVSWRRGRTGVPRVRGAIAVLECELSRALIAGDHEILIARVLCGAVRRGDPLVRFRGEYRQIPAGVRAVLRVGPGDAAVTERHDSPEGIT